MSCPSHISRWPPFPEIPPFIEAQNHQGPQRSFTPSTRAPNPPQVSYLEPSSYYARVPSRSPSPAPNFSRKVPSKTTVEQQYPRPAPRYFVDNNARRPAEAAPTAFPAHPPSRTHICPPEITRRDGSTSRGSSRSALTRSNTPSNSLFPIPPSNSISPIPPSNSISPIPPTTTTSSIEEADQTPSNLIQRFEKRIWGYNSSGNVAKRWLLEIISWIISAFCMTAIIGVLIAFKDKAPPRWLGLTINTYIAILSKIASAAMLLPTSEALGQLKWIWFQRESKKLWDFEIFDNASRGPWGAILLLLRTKGRSLSALGAAVTLFSLALDPFFQQVVDFPDRWVCTGVSSIPKVVRYAPDYGREIRGGHNKSLPDQDFQAVTDKFFYNNGTQPMSFGNGTRPDIPISCPTSNCTWDPYESLGICSKCVEIKELLTFGCLTTRVDWIANLTGFGTEYLYPNGTVCGHFLNISSTSPLLMSGYTVHSLNSSAGAAEAKEALLMRALPLTTNPDKRELFGGSINFKNIRNPITDVLIVSARNGVESVYRNVTPIVHECMLTWCVKTIQSSYYWANYEENVTKVVINETAGPSPWQVDIFGIPGGFMAFDQHYTQNISLRADDLDGPNYGVSNDTAYRTANIFEDMFPSFLTRPKSFFEPMLRNKFYQKGPMQRSIKRNPWIAPANVSRHMENLATALTNTIRSSSSNEMVHGQAYIKEVYVAVRWQWLILPLSLLLLSAVFLAATMIQSAREEVGIWKTSAIATLLYGLPDDLQNKITSTKSAKTPRDKAKTLRVKILPQTGWRASGYPLTPNTPGNRQIPMTSITRPSPMEPLPQPSGNQPPPGWI